MKPKNVTMTDFSKAPKMTAAEQQALRRKMAEMYGPESTRATVQVGEPVIALENTSDIELAIKTSRRLETLLEGQLGAIGRGLHEKINSVEAHLPEVALHHVRYIATIRNATIHQDGFSFPDRSLFIDYAQIVEQLILETARQIQKGPQADKPIVSPVAESATTYDPSKPAPWGKR
jgi:hypothetical protein